jgi:hypothetical protein
MAALMTLCAWRKDEQKGTKGRKKDKLHREALGF